MYLAQIVNLQAVSEEYFLLEYDALYSGRILPTFQGFMLSHVWSDYKGVLD
jgi:hypothetical protein